MDQAMPMQRRVRGLPAHLTQPTDLLTQLWGLIVIGVMILQVVLVITHQPFFDEWQAVQIAVQVPDLGMLVENLRYESHPPLWYLFLRGLASVVGPFHALAAASLLFGLATQWLILQESPLPRWARLALALSQPVLFEFIVVSRGHTIGLFLIVAALTYWNHKRLVSAPIALLPAVDFFYGLFAIGLLFIRWRQERLWWPGLAPFVVVGLVAAWSVYPAADYVPVYGASDGTLAHFRAALMNFSIVFAPLQGTFDQFGWNSKPPGMLRHVGWVFLLATMWSITRGRLAERVVLFGLFAAMWIFAATVYPLQNRHLLLLSLMLVTSLWLRADEGGTLCLQSRVWLAIGAGCGLWSAVFALNGTFDRSREIAEFIAAEGLKDAQWVALPEMAGQGVSALTGIGFERMQDGCLQSFVRWNVPRDAEVSDLEAWVEGQAAARGRFYVLSTIPLDPSPAAREIARFPLAQAKVRHFIYEIGPGELLETKTRPWCVEGLRPFSKTPAI